MGEQTIRGDVDPGELRLFTQRLLTDLRALQKMLDDGLFETGARRIGAEQELFLVDRHGRPASLAMEVLETLDDPHATTELARFNLELNLDPMDLGGDCLSRLEGQIDDLLANLRRAAAHHGCQPLLVGILPTLEKTHLSLDHMTPMPRYRALNDAFVNLRGGAFELRVRGSEELFLTHDNVMFEACNTSFQVHFQVGPEEFAPLYNIAQAVTAPVLAVATNSPLLLGRKLWRETRIALFQQSLDTRQATTHVREQSPRVSFGRRWVDDSVVEIFREDISRLRVLLSNTADEDPFQMLERGEIPELRALRLHNGTVYRWNRPCYGIMGGKPHLRIENRVLPSGPTPTDEIANAAFWFGLMKGMSERYDDITKSMAFSTAADNFKAASRLGLHAQFTWPGYPSIPVQDLILGELLPLARHGLEGLGIDSTDSDHYLGVVEERVRTLSTGAQWLLDTYEAMDDSRPRAERLAALTMALADRQATGEPVGTWKVEDLEPSGEWERHYAQVQHFMVTDLFTVNEDELVDLVASLMDWEHIRHVPVEDDEHRLAGLVTHRTLLRLLSQGRVDPGAPIPVSEIMQRDLVTVHPWTSTLEAIQTMKKHRIGCLPVVDADERLVGIVTERDFMNIAGQLLEEHLSS